MGNRKARPYILMFQQIRFKAIA